MSNLTAYDFAKGQTGPSGTWTFGTENSAQALRALADRIDAGQVIVEKVHVTTIARGDEFTETVLVLRFEEKSS